MSSVDLAASDSPALHKACLQGNQEEQRAAYQTLWDYLLPSVTYMLRHLPDSHDLAADITQQALIRIHTRTQECHSPGAFRSWCRRIATNLALDELRRRKRLVPHDEEENGANGSAPSAENAALGAVQAEELRALLTRAPLSERSFRVVVGRYLDEQLDEDLARVESNLSGNTVLPSHVQVTRSKNLAKLRGWPDLRSFLV